MKSFMATVLQHTVALRKWILRSELTSDYKVNGLVDGDVAMAEQKIPDFAEMKQIWPVSGRKLSETIQSSSREWTNIFTGNAESNGLYEKAGRWTKSVIYFCCLTFANH
jgi:hypothetical protein